MLRSAKKLDRCFSADSSVHFAINNIYAIIKRIGQSAIWNTISDTTKRLVERLRRQHSNHPVLHHHHLRRIFCSHKLPTKIPTNCNAKKWRMEHINSYMRWNMILLEKTARKKISEGENILSTAKI